MAASLQRVTISGFKSISDLKSLELRDLNVLIGANGAGKSNFVDFFRLLRAMAEEGLAGFVRERGGADGFFFNGPKITPAIMAQLEFGQNEYRFELTSTVGGDLVFKNEDTYFAGSKKWYLHGGGRTESRLKLWKEDRSGLGDWLSVEGHISKAVSGWVVYHVHDTSSTARMRREQQVRDFRTLAPDAGNIAAFLYRMRGSGLHSADSKTPGVVRSTHGISRPHYDRIRSTIQLIAPFFDDFLLEPETKGDNEVIRLEWRQKGSVFPFQPWQLSDGTIRFICLATALLQPTPPPTIVIDEPELGLHPYALELLASLVKEASARTQIIVSTQSPAFLSAFEPEDVLVVDRVEGASRFRRLERGPLADWLEDFTLGELVQKNIIEAGPTELPADARASSPI